MMNIKMDKKYVNTQGEDAGQFEFEVVEINTKDFIETLVILKCNKNPWIKRRKTIEEFEKYFVESDDENLEKRLADNKLARSLKTKIGKTVEQIETLEDHSKEINEQIYQLRVELLAYDELLKPLKQ